jgi:hypothetical protein
MDDLMLSRALHVIAVVVWIGGVAFVTALLPVLGRERKVRRGSALRCVQRRFAWIARGAVLIAGTAGSTWWSPMTRGTASARHLLVDAPDGGRMAIFRSFCSCSSQLVFERVQSALARRDPPVPTGWSRLHWC